MDAPLPGGLGGTFGGSPIGCAAALAVIDVDNEQGLVFLSCGIRGNVIRFLPALTISDELVNEGLDIIEACWNDRIDQACQATNQNLANADAH